MITNVVSKENLRLVQLETLKTIAEIISASFGPYGSNTIISMKDSLPRYTKDGHTILKSIQIKGDVESSVLTDIEQETTAQAKKVGDSTTSITILSYLIFKRLAEIEKEYKDKYMPSDIVTTLKNIINQIKDEIGKNAGNKPKISDMKKIALISTNGDENLAAIVNEIYEEYGLDVFVDVIAGIGTETEMKSLDGMILDCGYGDVSLVNESEKNKCSVRNPNIYFFRDPIDTIEMGSFFDLILNDNIIDPIFRNKTPENAVPTVIICPKLSRDYTSYMSSISTYCLQAKQNGIASALPLNIITDVSGTDFEAYDDIRELCGAKFISKYIDPDIQKRDIEAGIAPTPETIHTFAGSAELVESDNAKTKFVNPSMQYEKDGSYSSVFRARLDFIMSEITKLENEGNGTTEIYKLKKRLNSLKGNMVEIYMGGVSVADRDQARDLMEDAILNCRSAAQNGVGFGSNFEGLRAAIIVSNRYENNSQSFELESLISKYILDAYKEISVMLYATTMSTDNANLTMENSLKQNCPYNIRTKEYDGNVLSSIDTDISALDTISKIVGLMVTANQFVLPSFNINNY